MTKIKTGQFELHNLADDLAEQHDLSEDQPKKAKQLLANQLTNASLKQSH